MTEGPDRSLRLTMSWLTQTDQLLKKCTETFGETCTFTPAAGDPFTFTGIFDPAHQQISSNGMEISALGPSVGIKLSDFEANPEQGDGVTIRGVNYVVVDFQPDGQGGALLSLHEAD